MLTFSVPDFPQSLSSLASGAAEHATFVQRHAEEEAAARKLDGSEKRQVSY